MQIKELTKEKINLIGEKMYHEIMDPYENIEIALGIEEEGRVVAGIFGGMISKHTFYIQTLFVDDALRGKGYGKALVKALEGKTKDLGIPMIRLSTENGQAEEFYPKVGYDKIAVYEHEGTREAFFMKLTEKSSLGDFFIRDLTEEETYDVDDRLYGVLETFDEKEINLGVVVDGELVGGIFGSRSAVNVFVIDGIFVEKPHRGNGYGKALVEAFEEQVKHLGIPIVRLGTKSGHGKAFFEALGYERFGGYVNDLMAEDFFVKVI